jgi:hypothetical protein
MRFDIVIVDLQSDVILLMLSQSANPSRRSRKFAVFSHAPHSARYKSVCSGQRLGNNVVMKILMFTSNSCMDSGNIMTEISRQLLSNSLTRVIAINLICLVIFIAFCAVMTLGSPSQLLTYWNEHRTASVLVIMIAILSIPGLVELSLSRWGIWRR